jgi:hypothetical protein
MVLVVGLASTFVISAYHHLSCEFDSSYNFMRSSSSVGCGRSIDFSNNKLNTQPADATWQGLPSSTEKLGIENIDKV